MSSRALRKLQREQEQQKQLATLQSEDAPEESEEETAVPAATKPKINAFDLLDAADGGADEDDNEDNEEAHVDEDGDQDDGIDLPDNSTSTPSKSKKSKRKKKQKKKKDKPAEDEEAKGAKAVPDLDEIDQALKALSTREGSSTQRSLEDTNADAPTSSNQDIIFHLLSIDPKNLNSMNEMKKLFGNVALETPPPPQTVDEGGRRGRRNIDLGEALTGRQSPASKGQGLAGLASRRNVLMQGKEDWPKAPSGGLGMEVVDKMHGVTVFKFVHNAAYRDVQGQFETCVQTMDPERMIQLLRFNPYHISTLLQVSEIAKHQGDHSVSGDLLERALFSFGRSVHSTFSTALREGKARLEFNNSRENREFWLTIWRYITNLGMKGTWRTGYEWAKLLYQLNPYTDPYAINLMIDQLALRGREHEHFISFCGEDAFGVTWDYLPNIQISLSLAYFKAKRPRDARSQLATTMSKYKWIFVRLFQELNLEPIPPAIWGSQPRTDADKFFSELYVTRAKDLWNTPETTSLLMEVANSGNITDVAAPELKISLEEARHAMLLEVPAIIALIPASFRNMPTSSSDVLPPPGQEGADHYSALPNLVARPPPNLPNADNNELNPMLNAEPGWLGGFLDWLRGRGTVTNDEAAERLQQLTEYEDGGEDRDILQPPGGFDQYYLGSEDALADNEQLRAQIRSQQGRGGQEAGHTGFLDEEDFEMIREEIRRDREAGMEHRFRQMALDQVADGTGVAEGDMSDTSSEMPDLVDADDRDPPPLPGPSRSVPPAQHEEPAPDPQRTQRWLVGTGLQELKTYLATNPTSTAQPSTPLNEYIRRLKTLSKRERDFIVNYPLQQGAGNEVRDTVRAEMRRRGID